MSELDLGRSIDVDGSWSMIGSDGLYPEIKQPSNEAAAHALESEVERRVAHGEPVTDLYSRRSPVEIVRASWGDEKTTVAENLGFTAFMGVVVVGAEFIKLKDRFLPKRSV